MRTIDVLPTIAKAAGVRLPWKADGIPADEREVDPEAPIDISHMGEPVLTEALGSVLAKRRAREGVEARLLRDGVYAIGPRPELIGRRVAAASGGKRVMVDDANGVLPSFVSGRVEGLEPDTVLAVAVNGRVQATTRAYRDGGRSVFAALVPPSSLREGPNAVSVFEVLAGGELRPLDGVLTTFVSGRVEGLEPDTELAVAVNGRVRATTRAYRDGGRRSSPHSCRHRHCAKGPTPCRCSRCSRPASCGRWTELWVSERTRRGRRAAW